LISDFSLPFYTFYATFSRLIRIAVAFFFTTPAFLSFYVGLSFLLGG